MACSLFGRQDERKRQMKKCFLTENGPKAIGPYSTACICGGMCYLSGLIGIQPETGALAADGVEAQARQAMENMRIVLGELGLGMEDVVKTTVFLADLNDFGKVNQIYADCFGPSYPARSCVEVSRLPMGALVEIEAIVEAG